MSLEKVSEWCRENNACASRELEDERLCFATAYCEACTGKFCDYQNSPEHSQKDLNYWARFYICSFKKR